ncbi:MAG: hypothetical protein GX029_05630 [Pseudomonadaceae bacterium]|nr:hypothetical protein [Pseudomonadaceae bacterium]
MTYHTFRLVQLTDLHLLANPETNYRGENTATRFLAGLAIAKRLNPDLLLLTGDLAEDEQLATYQWLYQQLEKSGLAWQWLPGNHDQPKLMAGLRPTDFYQLTEHWQLLGLNSHLPKATQGRLAKAQLEKLKLALSNPKPLLIALHHPPIAVNSHWKDALALENAAEFWSLLEDKNHAKLVVFGHVHQAFSCHKYHSHTLATPATAIQFTANSHSFTIDNSALPAVRLIRLKPAGRYSTRLIYFPIP